MRISFKAKIIFFAAALILIPTTFLMVYFLMNINGLTNFSLEQNKQNITESTQEYLVSFVQEETKLIYKDLESALSGLNILGEAAQTLIDNYDDLMSVDDLYYLEMYRNEYIPYKNALTNSTEDSRSNILIPPGLTDDPRSKQMVRFSALLNPYLKATFDSSEYSSLIYFVADQDNPVTRAYPNINLAEVLDSQGLLNFLFWSEGEQSFFGENMEPWRKFYTDESFRNSILETTGTPVTVEPPYEDAAGQGTTITMFYPLWDKKKNKFAGAVGLDITLNNIIRNIISLKVGESGYAFLMNGSGKIIAMPEKGFETLRVDLEKIQVGGLVYYAGSLLSSSDSAVQEISGRILSEESGITTLEMDNGSRNIIAYSTLPPINDKNYHTDSWKIAVIVPEAEVLTRLIQTDNEIRNNSKRVVIISVIAVAGMTLLVILLSIIVSSTITKDINQLSHAAGKISMKDYNTKITVKSKDEIGQLAETFNLMQKEIKNYTENLEKLVVDRTSELNIVNRGLADALEEIRVLNGKLANENLRLSSELEVAKKLQLMVLPGQEEINRIRDLDIACSMSPADEVGGDYYDIFQKENSVQLGIGDVTGHGLASGVLMLMTQTAVQTLSHTGITDMRTILTTLNRVLYNNVVRINEEKNMTLSLIDYKDHEYTVTGQHEAIILCRKDGKIEIIETDDLGIYVGMEPDISDFVNEMKIKLDKGDTMVLFTDGITEAVNEQGEQFGMERLCGAVAGNYTMAAQLLMESILAELNTFIGKAKTYDDISIIVIKQK